MSKTKTTTTTASIDQVPPYCYRRPGMSAEEGAGAAVKELGITHSCDALALLWELRRVAKGAPTDAGLYSRRGRGRKNATEAICESRWRSNQRKEQHMKHLSSGQRTQSGDRLRKLIAEWPEKLPISTRSDRLEKSPIGTRFHVAFEPTAKVAPITDNKGDTNEVATLIKSIHAGRIATNQPRFVKGK
ncbi:hypothetical protein [Ferribacterium limneticum]|uniref:hypothetical protein n=1 Tax=Ferribacterium limneticum TaxID=76259 RepID=UPI001CFBD25A|nr:hypothetical protein [Ferribacterium limneticum]UCV28116.1 hypothetical protein KI617_18035 [Ferribacterium limneticum]UCV32033.1 hypothetical protein KI608_18035 [Ferribacterium limneticum]